MPYKEILEDSYTKCPNCLAVFNYELHLRSYDDQTIESLMTSRGFTCTKKITTGKNESFYGHKTFRKIFYPEQLLKWNSPICPICGYKDSASDKREEKNETEQLNNSGGSRKLISYMGTIPKKIWPKVIKDYWVIACYKRK